MRHVLVLLLFPLMLCAGAPPAPVGAGRPSLPAGVEPARVWAAGCGRDTLACAQQALARQLRHRRRGGEHEGAPTGQAGPLALARAGWEQATQPQAQATARGRQQAQDVARLGAWVDEAIGQAQGRTR